MSHTNEQHIKFSNCLRCFWMTELHTQSTVHSKGCLWVLFEPWVLNISSPWFLFHLKYAFLSYKVTKHPSDCEFNMLQLFKGNQIMEQAKWSYGLARTADQTCGEIFLCHTQDIHLCVWEREGKKDKRVRLSYSFPSQPKSLQPGNSVTQFLLFLVELEEDFMFNFFFSPFYLL